MSRLSRQCRVLYVERPVSLLSFFTGSSDSSVGRQFWRSLKGGVRRESSSLYLLSVPPVLPLRFVGVINRINEFIRRRSILRAMQQLEVRDPVLWVYPPDAGRLIGQLGEAFSLYYCADDWAAQDQWWNRASDIRARENELAAKVNLIVGTSTKIAKKWSQQFANVLFVSNGADVASFRRARAPELLVPDDLQSIVHPRVGYIGFIDSRFDVGLYERLSASRPDWNFVIVGPVNERNLQLSVLRQRTNVHFLGARTREQLPAYLKGFDVCTIPYVCNTLSESIFPLKLFEYLAAGRPIVTTPLPELLPLGGYIRIAATPAEFAVCIERHLAEPPEPVSEAFLEANSWDAKAASLWEQLCQSYPPRSTTGSVTERTSD